MTSKADYTPEEWEILSDGFIVVGMAMMQADKSGLVGNMKEFAAFVRASMDTQTDAYLLNDLIQAVLDDKKFDRDADSQREYDLTIVMQHCALIADILDARSTPQEAAVFKHWLLSIAQAVANASSERGASSTASDAETNALASIQAALRA
jgi:hypothetical protein